MARTKDVRIGMKYERLLVLEIVTPGCKGYARCLCDCGTEIAILLKSLGLTKSCGCLARERSSSRATRHGMSLTPLYKAWCSMLARCSNPKRPDWHLYGGRGITVCERWHDFANFYADMGERPAGRTLDRINNDAGYSPDNCRWATPTEQMANRRPGAGVKPPARACRAGHEYTPKTMRRNGNGSRSCRICDRKTAAAYNARRKAKS